MSRDDVAGVSAVGAWVTHEVGGGDRAPMRIPRAGERDLGESPPGSPLLQAARTVGGSTGVTSSNGTSRGSRTATERAESHGYRTD